MNPVNARNPVNASSLAFRPTDFLYILGVIACSMSGLSEATKHLHGMRQLLFVAFITVVVVASMLWLRWRNLSGREPLRAVWLLLPWLLFCLLFAVLYPLSHRHILGTGSDRDDALRVSAAALVHGQYIYSARTFLGNAVTPLPGAILLSVPFYFMHNVGLENLFWLALLLVFAASYFRSNATALIYVLLLFGTSTAILDDFVVGGDFVTNAVYVCIAMWAVIQTHENRAALWMQIVSEIFLGLAIDSRPIYFIAFPLVFAYLWQKHERIGAIRAVLLSGFVALGLSLPFYLYKPAEFAPLHVTHKLDFIPARYHATVALPLLGFLIACFGFFLQLNRASLYLIMALALMAMVGLPGLISWFLAPFTLNGWYGLSLFSVPSVPFLLWVFAKYESEPAFLEKQQIGTAA